MRKKNTLPSSSHAPLEDDMTVNGSTASALHAGRRSIALSPCSARVQVDPSAITAHDVDAYDVAQTPGEAWRHMLMGLGEPSKRESAPPAPQSGAITP